MQEVLNQLLIQLKEQSFLELLAVLLALAYVWLAARQNSWCWPCALISTAIYSYLFWEVTLPFHVALNAYYIIMAIYGWRQWRGPASGTKQVKSWRVKQHVVSIVLLIIVSILLTKGAGSIFDEEYLYLDASITVFSVFTTVLVAHKVRENWLYWIVIDAVSAYLFFAKGLVLTSLLFVLYTFFAFYAYVQWGKDSKNNKLTLTEN
ncbi:nicotinamide riboside transporter PnuC [Paraglaciecola sp.]|uniref:nicotinamide riboside transporter PnuC n=1 Tax=Paraglaciecola sp. TaxID=1920173 RepID=UPI0030F3A0B5